MKSLLGLAEDCRCWPAAPAGSGGDVTLAPDCRGIHNQNATAASTTYPILMWTAFGSHNRRSYSPASACATKGTLLVEPSHASCGFLLRRTAESGGEATARADTVLRSKCASCGCSAGPGFQAAVAVAPRQPTSRPTLQVLALGPPCWLPLPRVSRPRPAASPPHASAALAPGAWLPLLPVRPRPSARGVGPVDRCPLLAGGGLHLPPWRPPSLAMLAPSACGIAPATQPQWPRVQASATSQQPQLASATSKQPQRAEASCQPALNQTHGTLRAKI